MPPSAMPPRAAGQPPRVDAATGWGSGVKVDQLTPWDTAGSAAPTAAGAPGPVIGHMGGHDAKSNEWSSSRDGTGRWSQPQQQPAAARPNYDNDINTWHGGSAGGTAHWGAAGHGGPPPPGNTGTWGAPAASGGAHHHDQHPVRFSFFHYTLSIHTCPSFQARLQYDPNPQTPGPWVPPQPTGSFTSIVSPIRVN